MQLNITLSTLVCDRFTGVRGACRAGDEIPDSADDRLRPVKYPPDDTSVELVNVLPQQGHKAQAELVMKNILTARVAG